MADVNNDGQQAQGQNDPNSNSSEGQTNSNTNIDYGKIEQMISKGTQQKESAILKSYFEQQGMTAEEAKQAMDSYKAKKAEEAEEEKNALQTTQTELETLKKEVMQGKVKTKATEVALDMGVDKNTMPYLLKLADLSKAVNEKGEIAEDVIKTAFEQVLKDVPALKTSNNSNTGFQIGANNDNNGQATKNNNVTTATKRWNRFN